MCISISSSCSSSSSSIVVVVVVVVVVVLVVVVVVVVVVAVAVRGDINIMFNFSSKIIYGDHIHLDHMGGACSINGGEQ